MANAVEVEPIRMGLVEISSLRTQGRNWPNVRSATWAFIPGSSPGGSLALPLVQNKCALRERG